MPDPFYHRSLTASGGIEEGEILAESREEALAHLRKAGFTPLKLRKGKAGVAAALQSDVALSDTPRRQDEEAFAREAGEMIRAGLPADEAFELAIDHIKTRRFRVAARQAWISLREGVPLPEALSRAGSSFSPMLVAMARAGAAEGDIGAALLRFADLERADLAARSALRSALAYPALLLVAAILSVGVLFVWVLPAFEGIFASNPEATPTPARIMFAVSGWVRGNLAILLGVLLGVPALVLILQKLPATRLTMARAALRVPLLGPLRRKAALARFHQTLGVLLGAGLPVEKALRIGGEMLGNAALEQAMRRVERDVAEGLGLSRALESRDLTTAASLRFVRLGERTGRLPEMLRRAGEIDERDARAALSGATQLLGPLLTIAVGLLIGMVIYAILSAILGVYDLGDG